MLAQRNPQAVYRRIDFEARVAGANPQELVRLCFEQVITGLGSAMVANERGDNRMKSEALTRAVSALTALQMGVSGEGAVVDALHQLYAAARRAALDSVLTFDTQTIGQVRQDFIEIGASMLG